MEPSISLHEMRAHDAPTEPAIRAVLHVYAGEPAPAYPALVTRAFATDARDGVVLRLHASPSRPELLAELRRGQPTLAILSPATALVAIASGLAARIVGAAAGPADLSHIDLEPSVVAETGDTRPRAVLLAPLRVLTQSPRSVEGAVRAYARGAARAAAEPVLLARLLAGEFGFTAASAAREAHHAIGTWQPGAPLDVAALARLMRALQRRGAVGAELSLNDVVDARFVDGL